MNGFTHLTRGNKQDLSFDEVHDNYISHNHKWTCSNIGEFSKYGILVENKDSLVIGALYCKHK